MWSFLIIFSLLILLISAQFDYCNQICNACVEDTVSCNKAGFTQMPFQMSKTIKKLLLLNQRFADKSLSRENFTAISPPHVELLHLTIRNSNINLIKPETFIDLKKLKSLDLSNNYDLLIQSRSFYGLNLTLLKIDNIDNIRFAKNAFEGCIVESLHMTKSQISDIPYSLLKPILPSLTKLFLDNNLLVTIDVRYQVHFKNFKVLYLQNNPISCSCSMKWLAEVYQYRRDNDKVNKNTFEGNENSPTCAEPKYLVGKYLHEVSLSKFLCDSPTLSQLKIDFQSLTRTELSCSAIQEVNEATMSLKWFTEIGIKTNLSSFFNSAEESTNNKKVYTESIVISKKKSVDSFHCIATNVNGNATAKIRINWPLFEKSIDDEKHTYQISSDGYQKPDEDNYFFQKRFTLLEMLGAVIGTFSLTLLIFFLIYKIFFFNKHLNRKSIPQQNGYSTYEAAVYSESQTYDVPSNSYPQAVLLPMPHLSTTPDHFLDFKTQKRFYQTT